MKQAPSKEEVCAIVSYDPETGFFVRKGSGKRADTSMKIGYRRVRMTLGGEKCEFYAHRLAWLVTHGSWPEDEIDHIDGKRGNNSILNLRAVTRAENAKNLKLRHDNRSGFPGVVRHQLGWKVLVGRKYVGFHGCIAKALSARKAAQFADGYHENHGRMT